MYGVASTSSASKQELGSLQPTDAGSSEDLVSLEWFHSVMGIES